MKWNRESLKKELVLVEIPINEETNLVPRVIESNITHRFPFCTQQHESIQKLLVLVIYKTFFSQAYRKRCSSNFFFFWKIDALVLLKISIVLCQPLKVCKLIIWPFIFKEILNKKTTTFTTPLNHQHFAW